MHLGRETGHCAGPSGLVTYNVLTVGSTPPLTLKGKTPNKRLFRSLGVRVCVCVSTCVCS